MIKLDVRGNAPELRELVSGITAPRQFWTLFNSPESMADYVSGFKGYDRQPWESDDPSFYGTRSMPEARKLAVDGWPEGAERAVRLRDKINAANPIGPRVVRYDVAGAYPVIPRAVSGNPLNMRRPVPASLKRRPVITLLSDMSSNCGVDAKALENRAAVVAALIDAIEAARFSVHVIAVATGDSRSQRDQAEFMAITGVTLKEPEQPADIGRLAFGLGHPSMLRRFAFGSWVADKWTKPFVGMHACYPWSPRIHDASKSVFSLPGLNKTQQHFATENQAATAGLKLMIAELSKQGCPAFPVSDEAQAA